LIITIIGGAFLFYVSTVSARSVQEEKNKSYEMGLQNQEKKTETMRIEWREDVKEIKMNIDAIRESQVRDKYNNERVSK